MLFVMVLCVKLALQQALWHVYHYHVHDPIIYHSAALTYQ